MPFGWTTEAGPRPEFAELYGMEEHESPEYPARTRENVNASHVTLWWGKTGSAGHLCTLRACSFYENRMIHADYYGHDECLAELARESRQRRPLVINCAGNRESGNPGVGAAAEAFFYTLFEELNRRLV